jgi:glyceraldehyde-3-phosphate dehydrogenase/erythrose-4-phosphate dehydrogenase
VPVVDGSLVDLGVLLHQEVSADDVNAARAAASAAVNGALSVSR